MAGNEYLNIKTNSSKFWFRVENFYVLLIIFIPLIAWSPIIFTIFFNDDFQLLGWYKPGTLTDCLKPFWTQDISGVYWRPLINSIHAFVQYLFGFLPLPFRILTIVMYIGICLQFFKLLQMLGARQQNAFLVTILFSIMPSHEIIVGWIAGRDLFAMFFLFFTFIFYIKSISENSTRFYFFSILFYTLAILTKEIAIMGLFLPLIYMFLDGSKNLRMKHGLISFAVFFIITIMVFIYRIHLTGTALLSSPNITNPDISIIAKNFFIYIFLAFISPELLEQFYYNTPLIIFSIFIIIGIIIYIFSKKIYRINLSVDNKKPLLFGIAWYLIFILPALPMLMRWYVFIASVGLFIALSAILENYFVSHKNKWGNFFQFRPLILITLIIIYIVSSVYDFIRMEQWRSTGSKTDKILKSLMDYDLTNTKQVILWASPDKFNWVNALKVGTHSAIHQYTGNYNLEVNAPLRYEGDIDANIKIKYTDNQRVILTTTTGRFVIFGQSFTTIPRSQEISKQYKDFEINIQTWKENEIFYSKAEILFKQKDIQTLNLFFDGNQFRTIL